jgi:sec-independent protein translocase protein TatA
MVLQLALPEGGEWIVILVIVVLLFGAKKLPELTRNAARAMKEFDKARHGDDDETPAQVTAQQTPGGPTAAPSSTPATGAPVSTSDPAPQAPVDGSGGRVDLDGGRSEGGGQ